MSRGLPRRLSEVAAIAAPYGSALVQQGGGKHNWRFVKAAKRPYTVPAHQGLRTMVPWVYILGLCRNHDIPVEAFRDN